MYKCDRGTFNGLWDAMAYPGYNGHLLTTALSRQLLLKLIKDDESFLDVGCAVGITCLLFKEFKPSIRYKGVDYSEKMVEVARKCYPDSDFEVQSAYKLKEKDNSFDTVYLKQVLGTLKGYKEAISEAFRVAKKRVILDMRRGFTKNDLPDKIGYNKERDTYVADYNWSNFDRLLRHLSTNVSYLMGKDIEPVEDSSTFIVIGKEPEFTSKKLKTILKDLIKERGGEKK